MSKNLFGTIEAPFITIIRKLPPKHSTMKHTRHLFFFSIFALFCTAIQANDRKDFYSDSAIVTKRIATEGEKQAIADAINKYLDAVGIKIGDLNVSSTADGGKEASGNVSFFGFDNINLKAAMTADRKIKSISTAFPDAASLSIDKLSKFLSGKSLSSFLPKSFPLSTGISIKDLSIDFDDKGDSLSKVALNFGVGSYAIEGFDGFAIDGMSIGFTLDKPTSPQRKATAVVSGDGKIGVVPISLSATMGSDPDDLLFSFTASNIGISSLLNSFLSEGKANKLLRFIPESFKSKEISSVTASINPTNKNFSALAQTSFGETEIQFNGATAEDKSTMLFAIAPPTGFKFSQLSNTLAPMDAIELSGTALIISTLADDDAKSNLSALKNEGDIKVEQGVNIFSTIKMSDDLAKLLKVNAIKLKGTCNETFTNMSMQAALDLNIPMGQSITMKEVVFGMRLGTVNPIELTIGGKIEAKVGNDLLGFNASFGFAPIDQKISGEFFMAALKKGNDAMLTGKKGVDGKSDLPEWTNPFGIPGVGLRKLGVSAGLDFKNPILISSLGLTGAARLGTVNDRTKHIEGDATIVVDITKPTNSLIDITMKNMTILAMIEAFVDNANIQGQLRTMLNTGIDRGRILVVPVDGMQAFGKTYNKGVAVSGQLSLAGIKANGDFSLNETGVSGAGSMDVINWGNGAFIISGRTTDKPQFSFSYTKGSVPSFFIDGKISLLGISSETTASLDATGFAFTTTGKIANAFEATLEGKGSFTESAKGIYVRAALRNDLVSQLNAMVTGKINEAIQTTKNTLQGTRDKLKQAQASLKYYDDEIAKRTAELQGQKAAANQAIRNEAKRAMKEQQDFINTCIANNASSQRKIDALGNWPWELLEKAGYYTAIAANNTGIGSARVAYAGYLATVNSTADVVEAFPNDILLSDLYIKKGLAQTGLAIANAGVDIAEGVSVATLEATKWVMDKALGGLFDIKSAEFAGTFGLNSQYKVNTALNFTLGGNPYNMVAELDFNNLTASAGKIATDILSGTLIKSGYAKTFATELSKPVSNITLATAPTAIGAGNTTVAAVKPVDGQIVITGQVATGANSNSWQGKYFRIENLWRSGQRLNVEKETPTTSIINDDAWSAQWVIKPVTGTNYFWIENRWRAGERLNAEKELPTVGKIQDAALSAHWEFVKIGNNLYRIENRWKKGYRLNMENGKLECTKIGDGANSAMWYILSSGIVVAEVPPVVNVWTGKFVRIENVWKKDNVLQIETGSLSSAPINDGAWSANWVLKTVPNSKYIWIENRWKPTLRLNIETGTLTASAINDNALSAHWELKKVGENSYRIDNRWQAEKSIHIENGKIECSGISSMAQSALWTIRVMQ